MEEILSSYLYVLLALGLVLLNAFFVAAEFAIVRIRTSRLETLSRRGHFLARSARHAVQHMDSYLSAAQLGITIASLGLGWVGEPAFVVLVEPLLRGIGLESEQLVHSLAFLAGFTLITLLHLVLGEQVPKMAAIKMTETMALATALPLRIFRLIFFPFLWLLSAATNAILRILRVAPVNAELAHSEEELRFILAESARAGEVSGQKRRLLENVFKYSGRTAKEIMIPRAEIAYVSLARTWKENLDIIHSTQHTRYPLCTLSLDHVVGMVHIKDLFQHGEQIRSAEDVLKLKRDILFVPESGALDELQKQFQQKRMHMAVVVDEYGGTSGLVTLEDVLEELVGEIQDEFDRELPKVTHTPEGDLLDGLLLISEVNGQLNLGLEESSDARTVGGFVTEELGRIPHVGDRVTVNGRELRVVEMKGRRVSKVLVTAPRPAETGGATA